MLFCAVPKNRYYSEVVSLSVLRTDVKELSLWLLIVLVFIIKYYLANDMHTKIWIKCIQPASVVRVPLQTECLTVRKQWVARLEEALKTELDRLGMPFH